MQGDEEVWEGGLPGKLQDLPLDILYEESLSDIYRSEGEQNY